MDFGPAEALGFTVVDPTQIVPKTPPVKAAKVVAVSTETETGVMPAAYVYWDYDLRLANGTLIKTYTQDDFRDLEITTGYWGGVNDRPFDTDQYHDVSLLTLLEAVGGRCAKVACDLGPGSAAKSGLALNKEATTPGANRLNMDLFTQLHPVLQALLATVFTWLLTAVGASSVFFMKEMSRKTLDLMLGFAAGVMIAASVWSLLIPAMDFAEQAGTLPWIPALAGFVGGGLFLFVVDRILPHLHPGLSSEHTEGVHVSWNRTALLLAAITLHNIPEGLAVGVAFGAVAMEGGSGTTLAAALALALGIGIQNLPEGAAVSLPLRGAGISRSKSFFYGQLSAVVEPMAAVLGALLVTLARPALPYTLAFAAGAMIYVVVEEVIPESQCHGKNTDLATGGAMAGFALMMFLDVALG